MVAKLGDPLMEGLTHLQVGEVMCPKMMYGSELVISSSIAKVPISKVRVLGMTRWKSPLQQASGTH